MRVLPLALTVLAATFKPAAADVLTCPIHIDNLTDSMVVDTESETATVTSRFMSENHYVFYKNGTFTKAAVNGVRPHAVQDHILTENFDAVRPLAVKAIKSSACP